MSFDRVAPSTAQVLWSDDRDTRRCRKVRGKDLGQNASADLPQRKKTM